MDPPRSVFWTGRDSHELDCPFAAINAWDKHGPERIHAWDQCLGFALSKMCYSQRIWGHLLDKGKA